MESRDRWTQNFGMKVEWPEFLYLSPIYLVNVCLYSLWFPSSINHHAYPICCIFLRPDGLNQCLHVKQTSLFSGNSLVNPFKLHQGKRSISVVINSQDPCGNPRWKLMVNGKKKLLFASPAVGKRKRSVLISDTLNRRITRKVSSSRPLFLVPCDYLMHDQSSIEGRSET